MQFLFLFFEEMLLTKMQDLLLFVEDIGYFNVSPQRHSDLHVQSSRVKSTENPEYKKFRGEIHILLVCNKIRMLLIICRYMEKSPAWEKLQIFTTDCFDGIKQKLVFPE